MYGEIIVGSDLRKIPITAFVQATYEDNRLITVAKTEEGFSLSVENPESTGRSSQEMWLSEQTMIGLASTILIWYLSNGDKLEEKIKEMTESKHFSYLITENLKLIK